MFTLLQKFSQEINRFALWLKELYEEWPADCLISPAKQYLVDVEDIIQRYERHGAIVDLESVVAQDCHGLTTSDPCLTMDSPDFFRDATDHVEAMSEDDHSQCLTETEIEASGAVIGTRRSYSVIRDCDPPQEICEGIFDADISGQDSSTPGISSMPQTVDPWSVALGTSQVLQERGQADTQDPGRPLNTKPKSRLPARKSEPDQQKLVTRLYSNISCKSVEWDYEKITAAAKTISIPSLLGRNCKLSKILEALDGVEAVSRYYALARRMILLRLAEFRDQVEADVALIRCTVNKGQQIPGARKIQSEALDIMVKEAYPETAEDSVSTELGQWRAKYQSERKYIQNRLQTAKNWKEASRRFGCGIITQFPDGDHRQVALQH